MANFAVQRTIVTSLRALSTKVGDLGTKVREQEQRADGRYVERRAEIDHLQERLWLQAPATPELQVRGKTASQVEDDVLAILRLLELLSPRFGSDLRCTRCRVDGTAKTTRSSQSLLDRYRAVCEKSTKRTSGAQSVQTWVDAAKLRMPGGLPWPTDWHASTLLFQGVDTGSAVRAGADLWAVDDSGARHAVFRPRCGGAVSRLENAPTHKMRGRFASEAEKAWMYVQARKRPRWRRRSTRECQDGCTVGEVTSERDWAEEKPAQSTRVQDGDCRNKDCEVSNHNWKVLSPRKCVGSQVLLVGLKMRRLPAPEV